MLFQSHLFFVPLKISNSVCYVVDELLFDLELRTNVFLFNNVCLFQILPLYEQTALKKNLLHRALFTVFGHKECYEMITCARTKNAVFSFFQFTYFAE